MSFLFAHFCAPPQNRQIMHPSALTFLMKKRRQVSKWCYFSGRLEVVMMIDLPKRIVKTCSFFYSGRFGTRDRLIEFIKSYLRVICRYNKKIKQVASVDLVYKGKGAKKVKRRGLRTLRYLIAVVLRLFISNFLNRHYALIR